MALCANSSRGGCRLAAALGTGDGGANVSDEPSRTMALGKRRWEPVPGAASDPRPVKFPKLAALSDPEGWVSLGAAGALA